MLQDKEHKDLWRSLSSQQLREHQQQVARLEANLSELKQELNDRPEKPVVKYIGADELEAANDETSRAFRSRLRSYQTLAEILALHRERTPERCACGQPFGDCKVAQILSQHQAFTDWVDDQVSRLNSHSSCDLPTNFPARFNPRWRRSAT
jgi:hypothetical protein